MFWRDKFLKGLHMCNKNAHANLNHFSAVHFSSKKCTALDTF